MNMKKICLWILFIFTLFLTACGEKNGENKSASVYYVDSMFGNDENDGSFDNPIATLDAVNQLPLQAGDQVLFKRGTVYRGQLFPVSGSDFGNIYYGAYGEGENPVLLGSIGKDELEWIQVEKHIFRVKETIEVDVWNIILDDNTNFGVKKWSYEAMEVEGDYYYNSKEKWLYLYCQEDPTERYDSLECALTRHIIDESNRSYVTYENLTLKYGGAHGIGGGNTSHITIRNLEICYIGGGYLYIKEGRPVRFGNGIEFWSNASDNLVENCHIYEILDSGVTNQNNTKKAKQERISYINNYIHDCGMASFEFDNAPASGSMEDILFVGNVCENVGLGFGTTQDRYVNSEENMGLGHHIIVFYMEVPMKRVVIRNNTFKDAYQASGYRSMILFSNMTEEAKEGLVIEENIYQGKMDYFGILFENQEISFFDNEEAYQ